MLGEEENAAVLSERGGWPETVAGKKKRKPVF